DVERLDDIRMLDACREPCFIQEHGDEVWIQRKLRVQALDGHRPRKAGRPEQATEMHRGHPTRCERAKQRIAPDAPYLIRVGDARGTERCHGHGRRWSIEPVSPAIQTSPGAETNMPLTGPA